MRGSSFIGLTVLSGAPLIKQRSVAGSITEIECFRRYTCFQARVVWKPKSGDSALEMQVVSPPEGLFSISKSSGGAENTIQEFFHRHRPDEFLIF
jgi:hypothetical protein